MFSVFVFEKFCCLVPTAWEHSIRYIQVQLFELFLKLSFLRIPIDPRTLSSPRLPQQFLPKTRPKLTSGQADIIINISLIKRMDDLRRKLRIGNPFLQYNIFHETFKAELVDLIFKLLFFGIAGQHWDF